MLLNVCHNLDSNMRGAPYTDAPFFVVPELLWNGRQLRQFLEQATRVLFQPVFEAAT